MNSVTLAGGAALRHAQDGLGRGRGVDVFTANLHVVAGEAREALGDDSAASVSYAEALRINRALLSALLDAGGAPPDGGP